MKPIDRLSPNYDTRDGRPIDMLVFHYTGMPTAREALQRLCDPAAKVSAHYFVDEDGRIYRLVAETKRAWHAGESSWAGESGVNACSIGIELANPGHEHGYQEFPLAQMGAAVTLAQDIVARHKIPPARVLGHSDVAPLRKRDPGELFDWQRLARAGVGLWPGRVPGGRRLLEPGEESPEVEAFQENLAAFGYGVPVSGVYDDTTTAVVTALQRHFRPKKIDGVADSEVQALIERLREQVNRPAAG